MSRRYVSREKSEDKIMKDDVVQGLQLVSEDKDSQFGSEDNMFCPLEATESWTDVSICPQLADVQQVETRHLLEEYGDVFSDLPCHTDITGLDISKQTRLSLSIFVGLSIIIDPTLNQCVMFPLNRFLIICHDKLLINLSESYL